MQLQSSAAKVILLGLSSEVNLMEKAFSDLAPFLRGFQVQNKTRTARRKSGKCD